METEAKPVFNISADELEIFLADVNECVQAMETGILSLEQQADTETLNAIFRAAHTLKAIAGTVGHRPMAELTHAVETLFGKMREGEILPTETVADELLAVVDRLKVMRDEVINQQPTETDVTELLARLNVLLTEAVDEPLVPVASVLVSSRLNLAEAARAEALRGEGYTLFEVSITAQTGEDFAPAARLYQAGLALLEAGQIVAQKPALETLAEGEAHLWLVLAAQTELSTLNNLLREVVDLAEFHVSTLLEAPEVSLPVTPESPKKPNQHPSSPDKVVSTKKNDTVRISVERLDSLLNLVGELVTNRTRLLQVESMLQAEYSKSGSVGALSEMVPHFSHVVNQLQEEVMRARMLPIAHLFNKFPRLVREVARQANKQVTLVISGEATELDRAIIESIGDPLIHLLRNAVDHGIETPAERQAAGKSPTGMVRLTAAAVEGQIVITVTDDGRGIEPGRIRQAAVDRHLLSPEEAGQLDDSEAVELIFKPNLSTVTHVTEVSGRGVGMDVVRTNIERLSGSVVVSSQPGQGTTFRLTLPLTLALVQTMLVTVRNNLYAIPVTGVNGAMYISAAKLSTIKGQPCFDWQGATLPLLDLRQFFAHLRLGETSANGLKPSIVLVTWGKIRVGLAVDKIIGEQEIVVKALSPLLGHMPGLAGATILGDGRIAFIVDIPGLINSAILARR